MKKLLLAGTVALSLGGCASLQRDWNAVTGATVDPTAVIVAANSFDALEATATSYLNFCKSNRSLSVCASYVAVRAKLVPAVRSGRVARNNLETFMQQNPGALGPSGLYSALTAAVSTLQGVVAQYNISGSGAAK